MKQKYFTVSLVGLLILSCDNNNFTETNDSDKIKHFFHEKTKRDRTLEIEIAPFANDSAEFYYYEGNNARKEGKYYKAIRMFSNSLKFDSSHILNINNLAASHLEMQQFKFAKKYFLLALQTDSNNGITYVNIGNYALLSEDYRFGINICNKGVQKFEDTIIVTGLHLNLALLYSHIGQCDSSEINKKKAIEIGKHVPIKTMAGIISEIRNNCE